MHGPPAANVGYKEHRKQLALQCLEGISPTCTEQPVGYPTVVERQAQPASTITRSALTSRTFIRPAGQRAARTHGTHGQRRK